MNQFNKRNELRGRGFEVFKGPMYQQGYGKLGSFMKWIGSLFKKHALPVIKDGAKLISNEVFNSASNIAKDVIDGKNIKDTASLNFNNSVNYLKRKIEDQLDNKNQDINQINNTEEITGTGLKNSYKSNQQIKKPFLIFKKKKISRKNKKFSDIFD